MVKLIVKLEPYLRSLADMKDKEFLSTHLAEQTSLHEAAQHEWVKLLLNTFIRRLKALGIENMNHNVITYLFFITTFEL